MKILAVDDERSGLLVLHDAIKEAEPTAEVYSCREAEEALEYAKKHAIDVAFLDINMGNANGMELAKELVAIYPKINLIFVTGYSEYMQDAIRMHASGYILKPVDSDTVKRELDNLINTIRNQERVGIYVHTFGNFEVFADGKLVTFTLSKAKEMLAYLIDRDGAGVNRTELASALFEDRPYTKQVQDYITKIYRSLSISLKEVGAEGLLVKGRNIYAVETSAYDSDLKALLRGDEGARMEFRNEYMSQYSWAERTLGALNDIMRKTK